MSDFGLARMTELARIVPSDLSVRAGDASHRGTRLAPISTPTSPMRAMPRDKNAVSGDDTGGDGLEPSQRGAHSPDRASRASASPIAGRASWRDRSSPYLGNWRISKRSGDASEPASGSEEPERYRERDLSAEVRPRLHAASLGRPSPQCRRGHLRQRTKPPTARHTTARPLAAQVGTKRYMAPEASLPGYTCAVDIYSAGGTCFEIFEKELFSTPLQWTDAPAAVRPLIRSMCSERPRLRPTAIAAVESFEELQRKSGGGIFAGQRLRRQSESSLTSQSREAAAPESGQGECRDESRCCIQEGSREGSALPTPRAATAPADGSTTPAPRRTGGLIGRALAFFRGSGRRAVSPAPPSPGEAAQQPAGLETPRALSYSPPSVAATPPPRHEAACEASAHQPIVGAAQAVPHHASQCGPAHGSVGGYDEQPPSGQPAPRPNLCNTRVAPFNTPQPVRPPSASPMRARVNTPSGTATDEGGLGYRDRSPLARSGPCAITPATHARLGPPSPGMPTGTRE